MGRAPVQAGDAAPLGPARVAERAHEGQAREGLVIAGNRKSCHTQNELLLGVFFLNQVQTVCVQWKSLFKHNFSQS